MENLKKQRLATDNERSIKLAVQGYDSKKCNGKCIVHSSAIPKEISGRKPLFIINKIEHKCGKK